jgi:serine O-acetyltransferase
MKKFLFYCIYPLIAVCVWIRFRTLWNLKLYLRPKNIRNPYYFLLIKFYDITLKKMNSWIGYDSDIPYIPCFPHGISGIYISGSAKIGKNAVIFQQVTIGSNTLMGGGGKVGAPTIGDNVYIGAGAVIIGKITIGNNCRIGANTTVYMDVPDNSVVVSAPVRIIQKKELDNRFLQQKKGKWFYWDNGLWKEATKQR